MHRKHLSVERHLAQARRTIGEREMTSQLRLQHPVEFVVNDYAILLQFHIWRKYMKNPPYHCDTEDSFVIYYELIPTFD